MAQQQHLSNNFVANVGRDHKKLAAWFLGPKAENEQEFLELITSSLSGHTSWRKMYYPTDPSYIGKDIKESKQYKEQMAIIKEELSKLNDRLRNSLPIFSSRYKGHMLYDVSMIGMLGYFTAMMYNQNNVVTEGSAVTTLIEQEVGDDLCKMLQFRSHVEGFESENHPKAWGHLTSCGSVANIEAAWAARNVKYLAYMIHRAISVSEKEGAKDLEVTQANGTKIKLLDLDINNPDDVWILLNIPANNSLDLLHQYGDTLGGTDIALSATRSYGPQTKGLSAMPGGLPHYLVPATSHYSWPKAGAVLGMGEDRMEGVPVTSEGRLDVEKLRESLIDKVHKRIPVMLVVAIMGSTAEGAMDPIKDVADLRDELRRELNYDFNIHADAAWGGYCCTMLDPPVPPGAQPTKTPFVPVTRLSKHVREQLQNIHRADTITLDPHKAGYIQYPAGSICFQNKRMRDILAYKAPYITPKVGNLEDPSVGTYGIDGSRPGAAAVATYLHHRVTGLNPQGHGLLLGQANFNAKQFWALLATMAGEDDPFIIGQLHQPNPDLIPQLKLARSLPFEELVYNEDLMEVLQENGPDFLINDFAVNYSYPVLVLDGQRRTQNDSIAQSMKLMEAISTQLNTAFTQLDPDTTRPNGVSRKGLFLIRQTLYTETYSKAIRKFADAIKLPYDLEKDKEFSMLVSTNMEPWSSSPGVLDVFQSELRQAILRAIGVLHDTPAARSFVIVDAGNAEVFGEHIASFHSLSHNYQTILKFEFGLLDPDTNIISGNENVKYDMLHDYRQVSNRSNQPLVLEFPRESTMSSFLFCDEGAEWVEANVWLGTRRQKSLGTFQVRVSDILCNNHFDPAANYPENEKYFIFGAENKVYASHVVTKYPNYQHMIELQSVPPGVSELLRELGVVVILSSVTTASSRTENPLQVGFTYPTELVRENNETCASSLTVKRDIWFDASLNTKKYTMTVNALAESEEISFE